MDNKPFMRGSEAVGDLKSIVGSLRHGDCALDQALPKVLPLEQFRDNVRHSAFKANIVNGEDVGMIQGSSGSRFLFEASQMIRIVAGSRPNQLQCHIASQPFVAGAKDFAHRSRAYLFEDPVVTKELASHS